MNDDKHDGATKAKTNTEKPERSVRKSGWDVNQEIYPFATAILNQYILKLTIKRACEIPKLLQIEITHYDEMNDKICDINMNVLDDARNVIESISFHRFHGPSNSPIYL
jgi:hypothetical protein